MKKFVFLATWRLGGRSLKEIPLLALRAMKTFSKRTAANVFGSQKHDVELPTQVFSTGFPPSRE
ncbi:MAG: hypothetical protein R3B84_17590 [Zavarzinella sp.]